MGGGGLGAAGGQATAGHPLRCSAVLLRSQSDTERHCLMFPRAKEGVFCSGGPLRVFLTHLRFPRSWDWAPGGPRPLHQGPREGDRTESWAVRCRWSLPPFLSAETPSLKILFGFKQVSIATQVPVS